VEWDIGYTLNRNWSLSLVGAYNPARYSSYPNGSCPVEVDPATAPAGCDLSGERVGGSSDLTLAVGVDFQHPLPAWRAKLHAFANTSYRSELNVSPSLSLYGRQGGYTVVDAGFGIKLGEGRHEVNVLATVRGSETPLRSSRPSRFSL
jgi:iron complex outermembrane recepter protein